MIERVAVVSHLYHDGLCSRAFSVYVTLQSPPSPRHSEQSPVPSHAPHVARS